MYSLPRSTSMGLEPLIVRVGGVFGVGMTFTVLVILAIFSEESVTV